MTKKCYTYDVPYQGTLRVWVDAESEKEAEELISNRQWEDGDDIDDVFDTRPHAIKLVSVEDIPQ